MSDALENDGFVVTLAAYGFETAAEAKLYVDALVGAFCAMPESEPYASTVSFCTASEYLDEMNVAAIRARVAELEAALAEAADELDAYYRAEYGTDHPYHVRKLAEAMAANPARDAIRAAKEQNGSGT